MIMEKIVEICCGSYEDAYQAWLGGAKRIELNQALFLGGLTPSIGSLVLTKQNTDLNVVSMVRPRGAGFCYSDSEYESMLLDCKLLLEHGTDGIAFGFLLSDCSIDVARTKAFVDLIHSYGKEAVFHRAFDCVKDPFEAIEILISLGVDRLLTSGLQAKAMDGTSLLKQLQDRYGEQIQLLAGSGVNATNGTELMDTTGICQIHSSCKDWKQDATTCGTHVSYAYCPSDAYAYEIVSKELVEQLVQKVSS